MWRIFSGLIIGVLDLILSIPVKINSIAIDLSFATAEIESPAIDEHFSIRGFVSGVRSKDNKIYHPFAPEGEVCGAKECRLPPMHIPSFRWWQRSNCIPGTSAQRSDLEMVVAGSGFADTSYCQNVEGEKDSSLLLEKIGNKHESRDYADGEDSCAANAIIKSQTYRTEGKRAITSGIDKTKRGNACGDVTEIISDIRKRTNTTASASDGLPKAEGPSCRFYGPENTVSGYDGTSSALQHKRKLKLRSLADIMGDERHPGSENPTLRSASPNGIQLAIPTDGGKSIRSPQKRRKIAPEEDNGPSGTTYTSPTKTFRGLVLHADRLWRVESSISEKEGNAYIPLDLQIGTMTQQMKEKKSNASDASRKTRQIHVYNGKSPMKDLPKINSVSASNLQKHVVSSQRNFGNSECDPSILREKGTYFSKFPFGKQMERNSTMSKGKSSIVEASHNHLKPPRKRTLGDCNDKGKEEMDLSLNGVLNDERNSRNQLSYWPNRSIPDLNEKFDHKTASVPGKQLAVHSANRSLSLDKNLDISASYSRESIKEGKRPLEVLEQQTLQKTENNIEPNRASDDIKKDIVELVTMIQLRRKLGNLRKHQEPQRMNDTIKGSPSPFGVACRGFDSALANKRSGVTVENGHMEVNHPQPNKSGFKQGKLEGSQFKLFSSYIPCGEKKLSESSSMTGPSHTGGAKLSQLPRSAYLPFGADIHQNNNHSVRPSSSFVPSFSDQFHKGKTISDIKDLEEKGAAVNPRLLEEGRILSNLTPSGSLDPYSKDKIPAMQLLSLMDQRILSGSSFKVGPKGFLDKNLSPYNNHPRQDGNANQNFLDSSSSLLNNQSKDFSGLHYGVSCSAERKDLLQGQMPMEQGTPKGPHLNSTNNLVIRPARSQSGFEACSLNQNPADFTIPDAMNEFTVSSKDLKSSKRHGLKGKSHSQNVVVQKR